MTTLSVPVIPGRPMREAPAEKVVITGWRLIGERVFFTLLTIVCIETGWIVGSVFS